MTTHTNFHYVVSPFIYNMDTVEEKKRKGMFMHFVKIYKLLELLIHYYHCHYHKMTYN